jgi:hypothetical protein
MEAVCKFCNGYIDTEVCWCGDPIEIHSLWSGHTAVEMGCMCYHNEFDQESAYDDYLERLADEIS